MDGPREWWLTSLTCPNKSILMPDPKPLTPNPPHERVRLEPSLRCPGTLLGQHAQEISRSVKDAMDQDGVALHFVEDQIVVDDEHSIAKRRELGIVGNSTDEWVGLQRLQTGFDVIEHFSRGT